MDHQQNYFKQAYQTGSDIWSHIPYRHTALSMIPQIEPDSLILDIGAGRGLFTLSLVERGFRVLGIDYAANIVETVNQEIQSRGLSERARFITGNALNVPFIDRSFAMAIDIGTFQHIARYDWQSYVNELDRTLNTHGYYLNVSLSKRTKQFMGINPSTLLDGVFTKFGIHYQFFADDDMQHIFGERFLLINQQYESFSSPTDLNDEIILVFTLMQKRN